jgi:hypothetical protein
MGHMLSIPIVKLTLLWMLGPSTSSPASTPSSHGWDAVGACPSVQVRYSTPQGTNTVVGDPVVKESVGGLRLADDRAEDEDELEHVSAASE